MAPESRDIYQRFELQVRTPKKRLLIDAFLPPPESLEPTVAPQAPPPLPVPDMTVEEINMFRRREPDDDEPAPKLRSKKKPAARKKKEESMSLQDEVAEFMSRDRPALAPDDDLSALVDNALDPKPDPDKKG